MIIDRPHSHRVWTFKTTRPNESGSAGSAAPIDFTRNLLVKVIARQKTGLSIVAPKSSVFNRYTCELADMVMPQASSSRPPQALDGGSACAMAG